MKSIHKLSSLLLISTASACLSLSAQTFEVFFIERNHNLTQTSTTTTAVPSWLQAEGNFFFYAGTDYSSGQLFDLTINVGELSEALPSDEVGNSEFEASFSSLAELTSETPAGVYSFKQGSTTLAEVSVGAPNIPQHRLIKEYDALQNLDPTQPITISWDPFTRDSAAVDAILEIEVSYYDQSTEQDFDLWETPDEREGLLSGIDPSKTSVTIPANTFVGSPSGYYSIFLLYSDIFVIDETGNADNATAAWLETAELHIQVITQEPQPTEYWAGYEIDANGNANTFFGSINTNHADLNWIYSFDLSSFIYVRENDVTQDGAWLYVPR